MDKWHDSLFASRLSTIQFSFTAQGNLVSCLLRRHLPSAKKLTS